MQDVGRALSRSEGAPRMPCPPGSQREEALRQCVCDVRRVSHAGWNGEPTAQEDPVQILHKRHGRLTDEQPVGAGVRNNDAVGISAAHVLLVKPVWCEVKLERPGVWTALAPVVPLLPRALEVVTDGLIWIVRALDLDNQ